jgi:hypothetical protein
VSQAHIQLYVGDWRKDPAVQSLSYHHRGIWLELLMLMHCSEDRGRLVLSGKPMTNLNLSRLLGLSEQETADAVKCLLEGGVASRDQNGALVNRRMVREENIKKIRKQSGSKGGSKTSSKREATPFDLLPHPPPIPSSPPHTPPLTPQPPLPKYPAREQARQKVLDFASTLGISEKDADWFFYKGEGNGWTNGGRPILDWKATLRSWHRAGYLPSQKQAQQRKPDPNQDRQDREYLEARQKYG